jgi:hypothetical protein
MKASSNSRMQQLAANVNNSRSPKPMRQSSKKIKTEEEWEDLVGYLAAAILAVLLTLTCPGHTDLWIPTVTPTPTAKAVNTDVSGSASGLVSLNWPRLALAVVSYVVTVVAFLRLQGSDPGYLSASILQGLGDGYNITGGEEQEHKQEGACNGLACQSVTVSGAPSSSSSSLSSPSRRFPRTVTAAADDDDDDDDKNETDVRYRSTRRNVCRKCQIAPPLRAHHCKTCNRCVATFDHHCDFVGTCIGERNRCLFWWFLIAQTVSFWQCLALVESSSIHIHTSFYTLLWEWKFSFTWKVLRVCLAKLYLYPLTAAAVAMLLIHSVWAVGNTTTFEWSRSKHLEYFKGFRPMDFPFSRGMRQNLYYFFGLATESNNNNNCLQADDSKSTSKNTAPKWKPIIWQPPRGGRKIGRSIFVVSTEKAAMI